MLPELRSGAPRRTTMFSRKRVGAFALACLLARAASAQAQTSPTSAACAARVDRTTIMACALDASVAVYGEKIGLEAIEGRRETARVLLPSNPVIAGTLGDRL